MAGTGEADDLGSRVRRTHLDRRLLGDDRARASPQEEDRGLQPLPEVEEVLLVEPAVGLSDGGLVARREPGGAQREVFIGHRREERPQIVRRRLRPREPDLLEELVERRRVGGAPRPRQGRIGEDERPTELGMEDAERRGDTRPGRVTEHRRAMQAQLLRDRCDVPRVVRERVARAGIREATTADVHREGVEVTRKLESDELPGHRNTGYPGHHDERGLCGLAVLEHVQVTAVHLDEAALPAHRGRRNGATRLQGAPVPRTRHLLRARTTRS